jgi:hypothetical protein
LTEPRQYNDRHWKWIFREISNSGPGPSVVGATEAALRVIEDRIRPEIEKAIREQVAAESGVCPGCMTREQQRDHWIEASRRNGAEAEQAKQAWHREQDRAREAEAERDQLRKLLANPDALTEYAREIRHQAEQDEREFEQDRWADGP